MGFPISEQKQISDFFKHCDRIVDIFDKNYSRFLIRHF